MLHVCVSYCDYDTLTRVIHILTDDCSVAGNETSAISLTFLFNLLGNNHVEQQKVRVLDCFQRCMPHGTYICTLASWWNQQGSWQQDSDHSRAQRDFVLGHVHQRRLENLPRRVHEPSWSARRHENWRLRRSQGHFVALLSCVHAQRRAILDWAQKIQSWAIHEGRGRKATNARIHSLRWRVIHEISAMLSPLTNLGILSLRICVGKTFALTEMKFATAMLLRDFQIDSTKYGLTGTSEQFVLRPATVCPFIVKPLNN